MDNLNNPAPSQPDVNELRAQCESLRQLVTSLLVLLLVVSGTLNVYMWRQFQNTKRVLNAERQMVLDYAKGQGAAIDTFIKRLQEFEKKNPDFAPVLAKYGIAATGAPPATATSPAPAKK